MTKTYYNSTGYICTSTVVDEMVAGSGTTGEDEMMMGYSSSANGTVDGGYFKLQSSAIELGPCIKFITESTPSDPPTNRAYLYLASNGDLVIKINYNGTTKSATIVDYSSL